MLSFFKIVLKISVLITLWVFSTSVSYAQYYDDEELLEDPLVKPRIWSQLKQNPTDEYLWSRYFGKDLFDITPDEYQLYEILKNDLMNQDQGYQQELEQAKIERKIAQQAYTKNDYAVWTENISLNFGQIEVYFTEKFSAMGSEYVPYHELYPEEEYNLTKWVDEHEARLEELEEINMINNGDY